ncbi:hypothetical protein [Oceanithermus sp.]
MTTRRRYAGREYVLLLECEAPLAEGLAGRLREAGIAARVFSPYYDLAGIVPGGTGPVGVWVPLEAEEEARRLMGGEDGDVGD